jgi:hypothetical protein
MRKYITGAIIALALAGGTATALTTTVATASAPSAPVMLVCTAAAATNYALDVVVLTNGSKGGPQGSAMAFELGKSAAMAGAPFLNEVLKLSTALESVSKTGSFASTNRAFTALAGSCRASGDKITLFTL